MAGDREVRLTRLEELILWCLVARWPKPTSTDDLIWFCYGDDEQGGPLRADGVIKTKVSHINKKLARWPWHIAASWGWGYYLARRTVPKR